MTHQNGKIGLFDAMSSQNFSQINFTKIFRDTFTLSE